MLERYNAMLSTIRSLCPTAHIGGGAVRDTILGREIRDVDLFLDDAVTDDVAKTMRAEFGFVKVGEWVSYEQFSDPAVARVAKFEKADEVIPVCLVGLNGARGMQITFDASTSGRAWRLGTAMKFTLHQRLPPTSKQRLSHYTAPTTCRSSHTPCRAFAN